jgi:hypothetical protein
LPNKNRILNLLSNFSQISITADETIRQIADANRGYDYANATTIGPYQVFFSQVLETVYWPAGG